MSESVQEPRAIDLLHLAARVAIGVVKRKGLLALGLLLSAAFALVCAPRFPRTYQSDATLQLRKSLVTATSENAGLEPAETDGKITEDYREVQTELLQSELLHSRVAERLLEAGWPTPESWRETLSRSLSELRRDVPEPSAAQRLAALTRTIGESTQVARPLKSPIVVIRFRHEDPERAQQALAVMIEEYEACLGGLYDVSAPLRAAREQVELAEVEHETALAAFEAFQRENSLFDPEQALESTSAELVELGKLLAQRRAEHEAASERLASMEGSLGQMEPFFDSEPARVENKNRATLLNLLEVARRRLIESPFAEGTPEHALLSEPVVQLEGELANEPAFVVAENPRSPNTGYLHFQTLLGDARAAVPAAQAALAAVEARAKELRGEQDRIGTLRAEFERRSDGVALSRRRLDDAREQEHRIARVQTMSAAEQLWSVRVIESPTVPTRPSSLGWKVTVLLLFAAGAVLALGAVAVLGWRDPVVSSTLDLRACLGEGPLLAMPDVRRRRELREILRRVGSSEAAVVPPVTDELLLYRSLGAAARFLESRLDELVRSLLADRAQSGRGLAFAVCGVHAGAGASTIAANLALRLARRGDGPVLLVRRSPRASGNVGATRALPGVDGLELGIGAALELESLLASHAYVVIDGEPALDSDVDLALYRNVDACLLVARCDVTHKTVLAEAARTLLGVVGGRVGVVLNGLRYHLPPGLNLA
ncbi:MAG: hypothetical protein NTV21_12450 [Planctomycetota bacterium]|nr:hypothetical protein [Planctomycetota bacterium]